MTWLVTIGLTNAALASLLAPVVWVVGRRCRRPALVRLLWMLVLCKLLMPPLAAVPLGGWFDRPRRWVIELATADTPATSSLSPITYNQSPIPGHRSAGEMPSNGKSASAEPRPRQCGYLGGLMRKAASVSVLRLAAWIWIAGSLLALSRLSFRAFRFRSFVRRAARADEKLSERVASLSRRAGLASWPRALVVDSAVSPLLWGMGCNARLLFPAALLERLEGAACDALLLHELAHYARGDWRARLLELTAQVVYWWHPLVWWARGEIEAAEETCCDAWALERQAGPRRLYAEALLATIDFLSEPVRPLPPIACGLGDVPLLRARLTAIMCGDVSVHPSRIAKGLALGAAAVVLPLGPAIVGPLASAASARGTPPSVIGSLGPPAAPRAAAIRKPPADALAPAPRKPGELPAWATPLPPYRSGPTLYATAVSPNGKYQLEARTGRKITLVHVGADWRLDLTAHAIACASFSADSGTLATGHDDSAVRLWDCETGYLKGLLKGSGAAVTSVAFSADRERLAAGAADGSVVVWNWASAEEIARLPGQEARVSCLRWSPAGDRLAVSLGDWSNDERASFVVWRPGESGRLASYSIERSAGVLQWLADGRSLLLAGWDGRAEIWNLASGEMVQALELDKNLVSAAAWSTDCRLVNELRNGNRS